MSDYLVEGVYEKKEKTKQFTFKISKNKMN